MAKDSLPLGPCTSTLPACMANFTPCGRGIGLLPIRDIFRVPFQKTLCLLQSCAKPGAACCAPTKAWLPDFAEQFAAEIGFARGTAAHQTLRRGENADAEAANDRANFRGANIAARAGTRNALDAGDDAAAVRGVLEKYAQLFAGLV